MYDVKYKVDSRLPAGSQGSYNLKPLFGFHFCLLTSFKDCT
jgi:hypothetical protein